MIRFLIDADSAIYAMSGDFSVMYDRMTSCEPGEIAMSAISYAEVAHGTYVGKPPSREVLDAFVARDPAGEFR